ncbi:MAG: hypothetical protein QOE59_4 [Actinomycetota bacterium]|jgi:NAD(P)-dependent dehydrogenase (short-subunit alcohol dehydrogenase family)|nr:hypothetical protein [Actinomycetota bacterium]
MSNRTAFVIGGAQGIGPSDAGFVTGQTLSVSGGLTMA